MMTSSRCLPNMSPSRPAIGVTTDALSRKAVSSQVTLVVDVCTARWISGRAGSTSDCSSEYDSAPSAITAKVAW